MTLHPSEGRAGDTCGGIGDTIHIPVVPALGMDAACADKLDGTIPHDFWERKMSDWRMEEQQVKMAIQGLTSAETSDRALDAERIFELRNEAYSLYVSPNPTEQAKLLRMLFLNCSIDALSATIVYRKPFDAIV